MAGNGVQLKSTTRVGHMGLGNGVIVRMKAALVLEGMADPGLEVLQLPLLLEVGTPGVLGAAAQSLVEQGRWGGREVVLVEHVPDEQERVANATQGVAAGAAHGAPGEDVREAVEVGGLRVGAGLVEVESVIQRSLVSVQLSRVL